jgi:hypothetical protein
MAKYYVVSGKLKVVISGPHITCARQAACEALLMFRDHRLAPLILVNQRGFDLHSHNENEDVVLSTEEIAKEAGILEDRSEL